MVNLLYGLLAIGFTIVSYLIAVKVHRKFGLPFTVPVLISTVIIVTVLLLFHIPYETYMVGGHWINELLGPAVVALAYPLYVQRKLLKDLLGPILIGTTVGAIVGVTTGILLAKWAGFEEVIILSLAPKSVTTPVAMVIAQAEGGAFALAAVFVMIAGIGGAILSSIVFKLFNIEHDLGRGVGLGCASHAIGTARALESSALQGSVSSIAMVMSAVIVSIITPGLVTVLL
ncbi:LrgB family protein [Virgibacillus sp. MG-45]|uniref:LrgB family protein n=1 Tax=Virgibacillus sp. MG-45 TaxID=3102791 RepID=UPI002EDB4C48